MGDCPFFSQNITREYPMVISTQKKNRKQIVRFLVKTYHMEYPMVVFNPEIFKKRKQIVRFSVKTYHREYSMVIFNPEFKKNGSRLSVFQSKHTIGSTLWLFYPEKKKRKQIVRFS